MKSKQIIRENKSKSFFLVKNAKFQEIKFCPSGSLEFLGLSFPGSLSLLIFHLTLERNTADATENCMCKWLLCVPHLWCHANRLWVCWTNTARAVLAVGGSGDRTGMCGDCHKTWFWSAHCVLFFFKVSLLPISTLRFLSAGLFPVTTARCYFILSLKSGISTC